MFSRAYIFFAVSSLMLFGIPGPGRTNAAELVKLPRALYWDLRASIQPPQAPIQTLQGLGVSEVHIWLNDVQIGAAELDHCSPFSSTDSDGNPYWPPDALIAFTQSLKKAGIKPVYIFSPHIQSAAYIASLSGAQGPLGIARAQNGVPIELDLEGNWSESTPGNACATGDPATVTKMLINAIRDQDTPLSKRMPLKLIVSTTAAMSRRYPVLLKASDIVAPQLYDKDYASSAAGIDTEMRSIWLALDKPLTPALSAECPQDASNQGLCSSSIFDDGLRTVAQFASCPGTKFDIASYVVWSEVSIWRNSNFGQTYLAQTANKLISAVCSPPASGKLAYRIAK